MSLTPSRRPAALFAAGVLAITVGYLGAGVVGAEAGTPAAKTVTSAQVKKIAKAQAIKQITALAPTLTVKSAQTAQSAVTAQTAATATLATTATTAQSAVTASKVGGLNVLKSNATVLNDGAGAVVLNQSGLTVTATCPAGAPTLTAVTTGGKIRTSSTDGGNAVFTNGSNAAATVTMTNLTAANNLADVTLNYVAATGETASAWFGVRGAQTPAGCVFFGNAIVG